MLTRTQRDELLAHAREGAPNEVCGLLAGKDGVVVRIFRCRNVAGSDRVAEGLRREPARGYVMDPLDLLRAYHAIEDAGDEVLAYYHSHPDFASPNPSETDLREASEQKDALYVLVHRDAIHAYVIDGREVRPAPLEIRA